MKLFTKEKSWQYKGYWHVIIINQMGFRCGYTAIPKWHCLYGAHYNDATYKLNAYFDTIKNEYFNMPMSTANKKLGPFSVFMMAFDRFKVSPMLAILVHGGLTFSGSNHPINLPGHWWFGYDCGHAGDKPIPEYTSKYMLDFEKRHPNPFFGVIRSLDYCMHECLSLAEQFENVQKAYELRQEILKRRF